MTFSGVARDVAQNIQFAKGQFFIAKGWTLGIFIYYVTFGHCIITLSYIGV